MTRRLLEAWTRYLETTPKASLPAQRDECRRAFMAGGWAILDLVGQMFHGDASDFEAFRQDRT